MATHHDLLDAIARIRAATGDPDGWKTGLSGADIAVVTNPLSPQGEIAAVLAKMIAAHPASFQAVPPPGNAATPPARSEGVAAEALREAETALGQQKTSAAQVDLRVVTAVINAHSAHAEGIGELARLQREIEGAVAARSDLDTPAGARAFQWYLIDKMRDIRAVAQNLNAYPDSRVQVLGHTDNVGDAGYNQTLSYSRAQSVSDVLISEGVAAGRIQSIGRGESQPVSSNLTPEGRQLNRRVEIVILPNAA